MKCKKMLLLVFALGTLFLNAKEFLGVLYENNKIVFSKTNTKVFFSPAIDIPQQNRLHLNFDYAFKRHSSSKNSLGVKILWSDKDNKSLGETTPVLRFLFPKEQVAGKIYSYKRTILLDQIPKNATKAVLRLHIICNKNDFFEISNLKLLMPYEMNSDAHLNWFDGSLDISFSGYVPKGAKELKGVISNIYGEKITEKSIPIPSNNQKIYWQTKLPHPGFFKAEFFLTDANNKNAIMEKGYYAYITQGQLTGETQTYQRAHINFVATAQKARLSKDIPPQIGANISGKFGHTYAIQGDDVFRTRQLIGANFLRIHWISWDAIEKEKNVYDFSSFDNILDFAKKYGYEQNKLFANILETPQFYTNRPPNVIYKTNYRERYQFYPPSVDFSAWGRFISACVSRYPNMAGWEMWNEPHFSGSSMFWKSSPEDYITMLKEGYNAVKKNSPNTPVLFGGIGMRYLGFYEYVLKKGAGKYFDILPLHGTWNDRRIFDKVTSANKVSPKKIESNEWHTILVAPYREDIQSEQELAFNMLLDFINMLHSGIEKITYFNTFNFTMRGGFEREMVKFKASERLQIAGFFRTYPEKSPRLASLLLRIMIDQFSGNIKVEELKAIAENPTQYALLSSDYGKVLAFWQMGDKKIKIPQLLADAINDKIVMDDEGKIIDDCREILPLKLYYCQQPNAINNSNAVTLNSLKPFKKDKNLVLEQKIWGTYNKDAIFDKDLQLKSNIKWNKITDYRAIIDEPKSIEGRFAVGVNAKYFELCVEVDDSIHYISDKKSELDKKLFWNSDSLQFAIDCAGTGDFSNATEVIACDFNNYVGKIKIANIGGDIPDNFSYVSTNMKYITKKIEHENNKTTYKLKIAFSELYPLMLNKFKPIRFALLVNNNNGSGRLGYLYWGDGIGDIKSATSYGTLCLDNSLPDQKVKLLPFQNGEIVEQKDYISVKSNSNDKNKGHGVISEPIDVKPGSLVTISYEVRGNAGQLLAFWTGQNLKRTNVPTVHLNNQWQKCQYKLAVPENTKKLNFRIFIWQKPEKSFDIRNIQIN